MELQVVVNKIVYKVSLGAFSHDYDYMNKKVWSLYQTHVQGCYFFSILPFSSAGDISFQNGIHRYIGAVENVNRLKRVLMFNNLVPSKS